MVKDNRLLPFGYRTGLLVAGKAAAEEGTQEWELYDSLLPSSSLPLRPGSLDPGEDPDYRDGSGSDDIVYRVPLAAIPGAARVRAELVYQSLPPYYLRDRFALGRGTQTDRLYQVIGRLETSGTAIEGWKISVAAMERALPSTP